MRIFYIVWIIIIIKIPSNIRNFKIQTSSQNTRNILTVPLIRNLRDFYDIWNFVLYNAKVILISDKALLTLILYQNL